MTHSRKLLLLILILIFLMIYLNGWHRALSLSYIQNELQHFQLGYLDRPLQFSLGYMAVYIAVTALSLPGALIMTLLGGAIFGPYVGTVLIVLAASIGASIAFLVSRFLFRESLESKYSDKIALFNKGLSDSPASYVLFLRLVPAFPFFMINIVMGLTRISLLTFFFASLFGMLPASFVFAYAGRQLSMIQSLNGLISPNVLLAFAFLGVFALLPILIKRLKNQKGKI